MTMKKRATDTAMRERVAAGITLSGIVVGEAVAVVIGLSTEGMAGVLIGMLAGGAIAVGATLWAVLR